MRITGDRLTAIGWVPAQVAQFEARYPQGLEPKDFTEALDLIHFDDVGTLLSRQGLDEYHRLRTPARDQWRATRRAATDAFADACQAERDVHTAAQHRAQAAHTPTLRTELWRLANVAGDKYGAVKATKRPALDKAVRAADAVYNASCALAFGQALSEHGFCPVHPALYW